MEQVLDPESMILLKILEKIKKRHKWMGKNSSNSKLALHLENAVKNVPELDSSYLEAWLQEVTGVQGMDQDVKDRMKKLHEVFETCLIASD